jgi:hypothetical protein
MKCTHIGIFSYKAETAFRGNYLVLHEPLSTHILFNDCESSLRLCCERLNWRMYVYIDLGGTEGEDTFIYI